MIWLKRIKGRKWSHRSNVTQSCAEVGAMLVLFFLGSLFKKYPAILKGKDKGK